MVCVLWKKCSGCQQDQSQQLIFHGTLEVIERDVPVMLIKGEDKTRALMDRVEKFVNTISAL